MHFTGELTKSSKWELLHLKEVPYWHKAGSGLQEVFNRLKAAGKTNIAQMDTNTIEVWTTTMFALALQHTEGKIFWLGKPKNDPPDMAIMTITETGHFHAREIEVTRCVNEKNELTSNILKKDKENTFSEKYVLCAFVDLYGKYDLEKTAKDLQEKLINIRNVVVIFNGKGLSTLDEVVDEGQLRYVWTVVQLSPIFDAISIDVLVEYNKWLADPDKLRYTKDGKIYAGKRDKSDPYPTILSDTQLSP